MKKPLGLIAASALLLTLQGTAWAMEDGPHGGEGHHKMEQADTNQDGKISQDEFKAAQEKRGQEHFKKMDANSDGYVDKQEVQKDREKRREKMREHMQKRHEKMQQEKTN